MARIRVAKAERLLDRTIRVLDHGFVRLVDYMGGDARIAQAARVSYGAGTHAVREDEGLIDYLMRHGHTSPFEHVVLEFHCKMPIFVARQWMRHRTARINEVSGRYSVMPEECYLPPKDQVRRQSRDNKQGRADEPAPPALQARVRTTLRHAQQEAYAAYRSMLDEDVARELARISLPLSVYTEIYWQMDLHNLFHFIASRLNPHAQWEIRQYAEALLRIARAVAPAACHAFERHQLRGCRLSGPEREALAAILRGAPNPLRGQARAALEAKLSETASSDAAATPGSEATPPPAAESAPAPPSAPERLPCGLPASVSRDEINSLSIRRYEGPIHVIADDEALAEAASVLRGTPLLGFDTESRPSFERGQTFPVALLQFATPDACYIFQIQKLQHIEPLWAVLSDPACLKVGVAIDGDIQLLRERAAFEPAGFLDLAVETTRLGIRNNGLRALCALLLGFRISKNAQRTNWARDQLSPKQLVYAATDAWIGRKIYLNLVARGLIEDRSRKPAKPARHAAARGR